MGRFQFFSLAIAFVITPVLSSSPEAAELVGYWAFEETSGTTVLDESIYAHHGSLSGATRSEGMVGRGLILDGTGGVSIPNRAPLNAFPNGFTCSAWIKLNR